MKPLCFCLLLTFGLGCSNPNQLHAATTAFVPNVPAGAGKQRPLCLVSHRGSLSLAQDAQAADFEAMCTRAIAEQGIAIAPPDSQGCIKTEYKIAVTESGKAVHKGEYHVGDQSYHSSSKMVLNKTIAFTIRDEQRPQPLAEVHVAMNSVVEGVSKRTTYALCTAAFKEFPKELRSQQYYLDIPKDL